MPLILVHEEERKPAPRTLLCNID
uniref:Uncharacterized protein n=1 Tax=Arundo donax TaxID=35708 RepID=A0A0A9AVD0_ARUDO